MEIRLSNHAIDGMADAGLTREDVADIIEHPERTERGTTADEYEATLRGALYHVVVVKDSDPPLIITVYEVRS
jgi:hypothetical protein